MAELDLDAIRNREQAATPKPWIRGGQDGSGNRYIGALCQDCRPPCGHEGEVVATAGEDDSEFITRAREDIPALLAEVTRLRAVVDRIVADEQKCQAAIDADPTNPHLAGRLVGLQRARDIATGAAP